MSWLNEVTDILQQYKTAPSSAPPSNAAADFAKVAAHAPPFAQMISELFGNSNGE
jgi:hypothetical protein